MPEVNIISIIIFVTLIVVIPFLDLFFKRFQALKSNNLINPVVEAKLGKVIGKYKDLNIYEQVKLVDGRLFNYESAAVEFKPGFYLVDHCEQRYVVVDDHLLYREATA